MAPRHFRSLQDLSPDEFRQIIARATELKAMLREGTAHEFLKNKSLAMIFEKSSTRTRVSFEAGMTQMGGSAIFLSPTDSQLGRGEPVPDTARVLSRMVDVIMVRTFSQSTVEALAEHSQVPVINGLSDTYHPCQLLADMQTFFEHRGNIQGHRVCWVGDGNNMCNSYINAAALLDFELTIACPPGYEPLQELLQANRDRVQIVHDPEAAVAGASLVATDVWASMGQEDEMQKRRGHFARYEVTAELMALAKPDAIFLHCLPAHRGEEVTAEVMDGPASVVFDEAENRVHAQKAILGWCLT